MITARKIFLLLTILTINIHSIYGQEEITTDSRIHNYTYHEHDVYKLILHHGFQSSIVFAPNESIENIILGDSFAWKISPLGNRLFITALEKNILTNMTVITSKRTYHFDLIAKELKAGREKDLVYVINFKYPPNKRR